MISDRTYTPNPQVADEYPVPWANPRLYVARSIVLASQSSAASHDAPRDRHVQFRDSGAATKNKGLYLLRISERAGMWCQQIAMHAQSPALARIPDTGCSTSASAFLGQRVLRVGRLPVCRKSSSLAVFAVRPPN